MSDRSDHLQDGPHVARKFLEAVFTADIESGVIRIADRTIDDVFADFRERIKQLAIEPPADDAIAIEVSIEHRPRLIVLAEQHSAAGEHAIALILYATSIEHTINSLISRALERHDVSVRSTRTLLRAVNLDAKITALWEVAGIPAMNAELVKSIQRIASARNEFVHYKWNSEPDDPHAESSRDRQEAAIELCVKVVPAMSLLEEAYLWNGRRDEIMSEFRRRWPDEPSPSTT